VTDANFEQANIEASRTSLDKLYAEVMATRRREPQVLVRPGIGRVLRVR